MRAEMKRLTRLLFGVGLATPALLGALAVPQAELPSAEPPPKLARGLGPLIDLLRVLLKLKCEEHHVAQRLVATTADLEAIAAEAEPEVAALRGWRYEVFGKAARALKQGELGLAMQGGHLTLVPLVVPARSAEAAPGGQASGIAAPA